MFFYLSIYINDIQILRKMEMIGNFMIFESDEEFEDFCVAPYATLNKVKMEQATVLEIIQTFIKNVLKRANSLLLKTETQKYISGKRLQNVYR